MLFGTKTPLYTSVEIIDTILSDGTLLNKQGSVIIKRKEKRKTVQTGIIYFRGSEVYAASVSDKPIPIAQRVITGGMTDEESVRRIAKLAGGGHSPDVVRQVLVSNLITESLMDAYVKEHFLENVAEILSWENCVGEWVRDGITKDFTMPNIPFTKLKAIVLSRELKKNEFAKELSRFFKPEEFEDLCPVTKVKNDETFAQEIQALLEHSNGENTFDDIANITGIGKTVVIQTFQKLWVRGIVSLKLQAIELSYESAQKAKKKSEEVKETESIQRETLDIREAVIEKPSVEETIIKDTEVIDESLNGAEEINNVTLPTKDDNYDNEVFDTDEEDSYDNEALINSDTSIIEVIKKANATDFDIPQEYEVIETTEIADEPSALEDDDVAQSEDDLDAKMQLIYERYGFEKKEPESTPKKTQKREEAMTNSSTSNDQGTNDFDATDFDEIIAEFENTESEPELTIAGEASDFAEEFNSLDSEAYVPATDLDQSFDVEQEDEEQDDTVADENSETDDTTNIEQSFDDEQELPEPEDEKENLDTESAENTENEIDESDDEPEEEDTIDNTLPDEVEDKPTEPEETSEEETPDEETPVAEEGASAEQEDMETSADDDDTDDKKEDNSFGEESSLEINQLPEEIANIDLSFVEISTLPELMSKLSELQTADTLIDKEIANANSEETTNETLIAETYDKYIEHDTKLQAEEEQARIILDSYNLKLQEVDQLTTELENIREEYEKLLGATTHKEERIAQLVAKKEEIAQVIKTVTRAFSSNS